MFLYKKKGCSRSSYGQEFLVAYMNGQGNPEGLEIFFTAVASPMIPVSVAGTDWRAPQSRVNLNRFK